MEKLICIVCPIGCHLEITEKDGEFIVTGNECKRGPVYAKKELTNPTRVITSTVKIKNAIYERLPVNTKGEVPFDMIFKVMEELKTVEVKSPINCGDVVISNILNTGVDIVASRSM